MFETAKQSCNLRDEGQRVAYSNESPPIIEPHTDHLERAHLLARVMVCAWRARVLSNRDSSGRIPPDSR